MAYKGNPMVLSAALMHGLGIHLGAWMAREGEAGDYVSGSFYRKLARTAEAGVSCTPCSWPSRSPIRRTVSTVPAALSTPASPCR
jgi:hypothetical protein